MRRVLKGACGDKYEGRFGPIWFRAEPLVEKFRTFRKIGSIKKAYDTGLADARHAYVLLESPAAVRTVSAIMHGFKADDFHILRADGVGEQSTMQKFDRKRSVFVGNLPVSTSEAELRVALQPAGTVDAVRIIRDRKTRACTGVAFVRFKDRWSVKEALSMWAQVQDRWIRISKVEEQNGPKEEASERFGENMHPAEKRMLMRAQKRQRVRIHKALAPGTAALRGTRAKRIKSERANERKAKQKTGRGTKKVKSFKHKKPKAKTSKAGKR